MIVSHKYKVIFIHIYKNAGSYITYFMKKIDPNVEECGCAHITAKEAKAKFSFWDEYEKICIVRNSWDWQISLLFYMKGEPLHFEHDIVKDMSVSEYLMWRKSNVSQQKDFVIDYDGTVIINHIFRFETFIDEFKVFFMERHNTDITQYLPVTKVNSSKRETNYKYYYNNSDKELVYEMHKTDVDFFDFKY
jgi:hypothetical protein